MDIADMDAFSSAMQSQAAAQTMENDGVKPETMVILMEEKARWTGREGVSAWPLAERSRAAA